MTPEQFTYWLQGYAEIAGEQPTKEQWQIIKDHLQAVFHKVIPDRQIYWTPETNKAPDWLKPNTDRIVC